MGIAFTPHEGMSFTDAKGNESSIEFGDLTYKSRIESGKIPDVSIIKFENGEYGNIIKTDSGTIIIGFRAGFRPPFTNLYEYISLKRFAELIGDRTFINKLGMVIERIAKKYDLRDTDKQRLAGEKLDRTLLRTSEYKRILKSFNKAHEEYKRTYKSFQAGEADKREEWDKVWGKKANTFLTPNGIRERVKQALPVDVITEDMELLEFFDKVAGISITDDEKDEH